MARRKAEAKLLEKKRKKVNGWPSPCSSTSQSLNVEVADDPLSEEIRTQFGGYLTSQYELLERTLSCLNIVDLLNASLVCKSWHQTATNVLRKRDKNNKFRWHLQCKDCSAGKCFRYNMKYKWEFLLAFQIPKGDLSVVKELLGYKKSGKELYVPGLFGETFLIDSDCLEVPGYLTSNAFEYFSNRNAALFFPKTGRYMMQTNVLRDELKLPGAINRCMSTEKYGTLKGILVFAKNNNFRFIHILYNRILQELRSQPVALAGGLFSNIRQFSTNMSCAKSDIVFALCFYGDVDCYSDILTEQKKSGIEPFIKNMRQNLGDIDPTKYQRVAFVIRCLGRTNGKHENLMFQKYFPDTPAFVLVSYGECGYRADSSQCSDVPKRSRSDVSISYSYSTIYFFVTVKLP